MIESEGRDSLIAEQGSLSDHRELGEVQEIENAVRGSENACQDDQQGSSVGPWETDDHH